mmetsp:Transcript_12854/g.26649  ORF Transcript_12854/g.26649 Transcript_12854/m.26649 type:complete len:86 (+) Transcript_12854:655-912(+)
MQIQQQILKLPYLPAFGSTVAGEYSYCRRFLWDIDRERRRRNTQKICRRRRIIGKRTEFLLDTALCWQSSWFPNKSVVDVSPPTG